MPEPTPSMSSLHGGHTRWRRRLGWLAAVAAVTIGAVLCVAPWAKDTVPEQVPGDAFSQPGADPDHRLRQMAIGTWEDHYRGKRTMSLKADGTGTMVVELSGWQAALSASRLRFDMVWSVEGGRLKKRTVGGEPATPVQMILKTMGDRVEEPILELTAERLLLLDRDGQTKYDWRRVDAQDERQ